MDEELAKTKTEENRYSGNERAAIMMFSLPDEQVQKIFKYLESGEIKDAKTIMLLQYAKIHNLV